MDLKKLMSNLQRHKNIKNKQLHLIHKKKYLCHIIHLMIGIKVGKIVERLRNYNVGRINAEQLKKVIDECYCKHVAAKKNKNLYEDISSLLGKK